MGRVHTRPAKSRIGAHRTRPAGQLRAGSRGWTGCCQAKHEGTPVSPRRASSPRSETAASFQDSGSSAGDLQLVLLALAQEAQHPEYLRPEKKEGGPQEGDARRRRRRRPRGARRRIALRRSNPFPALAARRRQLPSSPLGRLSSPGCMRLHESFATDTRHSADQFDSSIVNRPRHLPQQA